MPEVFSSSSQRSAAQCSGAGSTVAARYFIPPVKTTAELSGELANGPGPERVSPSPEQFLNHSAGGSPPESPTSISRLEENTLMRSGQFSRALASMPAVLEVKHERKYH